MRQGVFQDLHPFGKLMLIVFLMGSCYLVIFFITALLAVPFFDMTFSGIIDYFRIGDYHEQKGMVSFFQITYSAGLFLIPALLAGLLIHGKSLEYLSARKSPAIFTTVIIILLMIVSIPVINFLVEFNMKLSLPEWLSGLEERIKEAEMDSEEMMDMFLSATSVCGFLINLLMIAIVPAIGEELLFRGVIQRLFTEWFRNHHASILITAALFSFMHFQFLGFLPRLFLGILFGYLMVWTGSVWTPVWAHFVNNTLAVVFFFLYNKGLIHYDLDTVGSNRDTIIYTAASTLLLFILMSGIYISEKRGRLADS
jgi:membrane protease YdiL (CAAX protease family)